MCEIVALAIGFLLILKAPKVLESVLIYFLNCVFLVNYCVYLTDYKKIYKKISLYTSWNSACVRWPKVQKMFAEIQQMFAEIQQMFPEIPYLW